jgi:hypothetical protein
MTLQSDHDDDILEVVSSSSDARIVADNHEKHLGVRCLMSDASKAELLL